MNMLSLIFAVAQTIAPVLSDNQWRPQDQAYAWPLPEPEWNVVYSHGDPFLNNSPPAGLGLSWECLLDEARKEATCFSNWDVKAGTTCRGDRPYVAWEHPTAWYERYRGVGPKASLTAVPSSRVYLWTYSQRLDQWPEWSYEPAYSWTFQRIQWHSSAPGCSPTQGCSARARYYIREGGGGGSFPDAPYQVSSPLGDLSAPHGCRAWLFHTNWCEVDPGRSECLPES